MSTRFLFSVSPEWTVTVSCDEAGAGALAAPRHLRRVPDGQSGFLPLPPEDEPTDPDAPQHKLSAGDVQEIMSTRRRITDRRPDAQIEVFGRYLFDALIGSSTWTAIRDAAAKIGATTIELALSCDPDDVDFQRLNWEMMHDGLRFVAAGADVAGRRVPVAITRVMAGTSAVLREVGSPPRVLFVIGAALNDPRVSPGAEYLGLLRQVRQDRLSVHARLLENATPRRLKATMERFRPDVVHFVAHGQVVSGRGYLELVADDDDQAGDPRRTADQLLSYLEVDGGFPPVVVLSACATAVINGQPVGSRLLGGTEVAPLAAELVRGKVPVVLGMAGEVSDNACRLFTRAFGAALVRGLSLVEATAIARRVVFDEGAPPHRSADWALPAVFLAASVDPEKLRRQNTADDPADWVANRITAYRLERPPVFCNRQNFFQSYFDLLEQKVKGVVAAYATDPEPGLGRTRLLEELAIQAIRDGNIPVLVRSDADSTQPRTTLRTFARTMYDAVLDVRDALELDPPARSQLILLSELGHGEAGKEEIDSRVRAHLLGRTELTGKAVRRALQLDLDALAEDARRSHGFIQGGAARVIVLLDDVDRYGDVAIALFDEMLGGFGLGTATVPVPVVVTFSLGGQLDQYLRSLVEGNSRPWLDKQPLRAFQPDGEDLMAYEMVLLHPVDGRIVPERAERSWAFNPIVTAVVRDKWVAKFRSYLRGRPVALTGDMMTILVDLAWGDEFLVAADDEKRLQQILVEMRAAI
jgi:hypothetical protein